MKGEEIRLRDMSIVTSTELLQQGFSYRPRNCATHAPGTERVPDGVNEAIVIRSIINCKTICIAVDENPCIPTCSTHIESRTEAYLAASEDIGRASAESKHILGSWIVDPRAARPPNKTTAGTPHPAPKKVASVAASIPLAPGTLLTANRSMNAIPLTQGALSKCRRGGGSSWEW